MNKSNLVKVLTSEYDLPVRKAAEIVDTIFERMFEALASGERIEIRGFGTLMVRAYGGYKGRHPKTGDEIAVKPKKLSFLRIGKDFKERLNQEWTAWKRSRSHE